MKCTRIYLYIFLSLLTSILLILAFPNFQISILAWISFIPLFFTIDNSSARKSFFLSYLSGIVFFGGILFWLTHVTKLGYSLLIFYLALYFGLFGLLGKTFLSKLRTSKFYFSQFILLPSLWVSLEFLRGELFTGFPWCILGYTQYKNPIIIQISDIAGSYGVSFLIIMVNFVLYSYLSIILNKISAHNAVSRGDFETVENLTLNADYRRLHTDGHRYLRQTHLRKSAFDLRKSALHSIIQHSHFRILELQTIILIFTLVSAVLYGNFNLNKNLVDTGLKLSVIQGNIEQEKKWDAAYKDYILARYEVLTKSAAKDKDDLIIWPETAVPGFLDDEDIGKRIRKLAKDIDIPLFLGAATYKFIDEKDCFFNSAILLSPDGDLTNRYDKLHLVPFGEYAPFEKYFPVIRDFINVEIGDYTPGEEFTLFDIKSKRDDHFKYAALICFEDIFPSLARKFVLNGADFLINITNDAWFKESNEQLQHAQASVFRAVENRISVLRTANTGFSCYINPNGIIEDSIYDRNTKSMYVPGYKTFELKISEKSSFYTRYGDIFSYICVAFVLATLLTVSLNQRRT
jgi:apolipoprotein N-acyltransferase